MRPSEHMHIFLTLLNPKVWLFYEYSYYLWLKILSIETKYQTTAGMKHSINFGPRLYNSLIKSNPELHELSKTKFKKKIRVLI